MKNQSPRQRLQQIIGVLAKYGLKQGVANPAALRRALEELGPTFVKIAQILSTRPDILPEPWREELAKLQDDVRPEPFDVIRATVEAELGGELGNFFAFFSPQPMASASIAQVHLARLLDGSPVVVKVKRPDIEQMIFNDLKLLKQLARLGRFFPQTSVWNPADVADELQQALELELDFQHEADNIRRFRLGHAGIRYIAIPRVYPRFSGRHVLVMEYIRGIKVSDRAALIAAGYDPEEICAKIVCNFMHQVLDLGFFHADLHPGNVLISANKIAYLDFGLVGNLSPRMKKHFGNLLTGIVEGDPEKIVASIIHMGIKKAGWSAVCSTPRSSTSTTTIFPLQSATWTSPTWRRKSFAFAARAGWPFPGTSPCLSRASWCWKAWSTAWPRTWSWWSSWRRTSVPASSAPGASARSCASMPAACSGQPGRACASPTSCWRC